MVRTMLFRMVTTARPLLQFTMPEPNMKHEAVIYTTVHRGCRLLQKFSWSASRGESSGACTLFTANCIRCSCLRLHETTLNLQGVSVPISIPLKQKRPSSPNESPAANEFVPPHQLSQQSHSHLAQSLPLTSSAQLRTRDLLMSATGMLPRHGPDGPLLDQPHGAKTDSTAEDGSILASSHRPGSQRRWDQLPQHSPAGVAQCSGGLSCPGREMQPFLRRTAPLERHPRLFPMVPEGH